jgi:hypothetical protein
MPGSDAYQEINFGHRNLEVIAHRLMRGRHQRACGVQIVSSKRSDRVEHALVLGDHVAGSPIERRWQPRHGWQFGNPHIP